MNAKRTLDDIDAPQGSTRRGRALFLVLAALFVALAAGGVWFAAWRKDQEREKAREEAERELAPLQKALDAAPTTTAEPYDVDKTIQVLAMLDRAAEGSGSTREYVERLVREDYSRVAPDVLAVRKELLGVLVKLAARLGTLEDHDRNWASYRAVLETAARLNSIHARVALGPFAGGVATDPEIRARATEELRKSLAERDELARALEPVREELLVALDHAPPVFRKHMKEWEELCLVRDSAYLAAARLDYESCASHARAAIAIAPSETEAHLLLAFAEIEGGLERGVEEQNVGAFLARYVADHPDWAAPALLLRGVWHARHGRSREAREDLDLAATRYPIQAARLRDRFDPYAARDYLRNTTQGRNITGTYQALMLGAGWFSPELQLARQAFAAGDRARGRSLVRDHFQRRRHDGQWNLVLYDIDFCEALLGDEFQAMFPDAAYLDLTIEATTLSSLARTAGDLVGKHTERVLEARVVNRSDRTLANAALVLCLRVTDMHPDDSFTVALPTQPAVPADTETLFGAFDVDPLWRERGKTADDLVQPMRAILLTDEAVFRIDTVQYKNDRLRSFTTTEGEPRTVSLPERVAQAVDRLRAEKDAIRFETSGLVGQDVKIVLPRDVAVLGPLFRLEYGEKRFDEVEDPGDVHHAIDDGKVVLVFDGAWLAMKLAKPAEVRLVARSLVRSVTLVFARRADGGYAFDRFEGL